MSALESIELWESIGGQEDKESGMPQSNNNFFPSLEEIELRELPKFRGWERRTSTRIEREEDHHSSSSSSLLMLPTFSDNVKVSIEDCPGFSYAHGQQLQMGLTVTSIKLAEQLLRDASLSQDPTPLLTVAPIPPSGRVTMTVSSKSLSTLTSILFSRMEDAEDLPVELFLSLLSLQSLVIRECCRLKSLPMTVILQYLSNLENLEIIDCLQLDFSEESGNQQGMPNLQSGKPTKLRQLKFSQIDKMKTLPWWIQHLTNLQYLSIGYCSNLKALPE